MEKLHIITPVSRPENLHTILDSIIYEDNFVPIKITWWVIFDGIIEENIIKEFKQLFFSVPKNNLVIEVIHSPIKKAIAGHAHRNIILNTLESKFDINDWVMFIDDDTKLHPNLVPFLVSARNKKYLDSKQAILGDQEVDNNILRLKADPANVKVCHVDTGQIIFRISFLKGQRFLENDYCADGHFIEEMYNKNKDAFYFPNIILSYYNLLQTKKEMETEEINILKQCPVQILQNEWEFTMLLGLYNGHRPKTVLEIGSFYGGTLWYWLQYGIELQKVISIDYPIPPSDDRYKEMIASRKEWNNWLKGRDISFFDLKGDSTSHIIIERAKNCVPNKDIDFLFIDGGHDYATVKADYENYSPLVAKNGLIVFHDVIGLEEVKQYWNELKQGKRYLEICDNNNVGWGIGVIFN